VPKVLDFGLAKPFHRQLGIEKPTNSSAGLLIGTLDYMAPEQVAGDEVSPDWDVWAIGVIAYEMLTAHHPFRRTVAFAGGQTVTDVAVDDRPDTPHLSDAAAAFFQTALSTERALRPKEVMGFLEACEHALA